MCILVLGHHTSIRASSLQGNNGDCTGFVASHPSSFSDTCATVDGWIRDSGASGTMTSNPSLVLDDRPYNDTDRVMIANGLFLRISHIGHGLISLPGCTLFLCTVLLVPDLTKNLLSIIQLVLDNPLTVSFNFRGLFIHSLAGHILHYIPLSSRSLFSLSTTTVATRDLWHSRLRNPSDYVFTKLSLPITNKVSQTKPCNSCSISKSTRLPFRVSNSCCTSPLHIIHCDIWGPSPTISRFGYRYFITFIDDYSIFTWMYPLSHRSQAIDCFRHFKASSENLLSTKIKFFQCDGAPELTQGPMGKFLFECGITYRISCPYTPQQNRVDELKNRHLSEIARALLFHSHLSQSFWYDAYAIAAFLINGSLLLLFHTPLHINFFFTLYLTTHYFVLSDVYVILSSVLHVLISFLLNPLHAFS